MNETFVKYDGQDVARALSDLAEKKLDNTQFLQTMMQAKLFTALDMPPSGALGADDKNVPKPMRVPDEEGGGAMIALFTDEQQAQEAKSRHPGFEYLGSVDVVWVMLHAEPGLGLLINPAQQQVFRIAPDGVAHLRETVQSAVKRG